MIIIFDRWGISSSCVQPTRSLTRRISFVPTGLRSTVVRRHFFMTRIYNSSNRRGITIKDRQRRPLLKSLPISRRGNKSNNLNSWWCSKNNNKLRFSSSNKFSNCTNDASKSIRYVYSKVPFLRTWKINKFLCNCYCWIADPTQDYSGSTEAAGTATGT